MTTLNAVLTSPDFNCDNLQISRVRGREAISQPFEFTIDVICTEPDDFNFDVLGKKLTLEFTQDGNPVREVHGVIARAEEVFATTAGNKASAYRFVLVPKFWLLSLIDGQQVYLRTSIPDIVQSKLVENGFAKSEYEMRLAGAYVPKPMVVQFHEKDTAFVNRLTENCGISYYFINSGGVEKLIFTDNTSGFSTVDGHDTVTVRTDGQRFDVFELAYTKTAMPKTWTVQDYNHRLPLLNVIGTFTETQGLMGKVHEFGPHVFTPVDGKAHAQMRAEAAVAETRYYYGASDQCWFRAGALVKFQGNTKVPESKPLLIVSVEHELTLKTVADQTIGAEDVEYRNTFRAVDGTQTYRPPLVTPKPRFYGVMTATVEPLQPLAGSPTTKDATIDENGDYTIRFHFDPAPLYPATGSRARSSLPVRMMQALAGPDYGIHFPLRGGVEVFVLFIDGDPDRPIIAAAVPNAVTVSPSTNTNSLESVMRTRSGITVTFRDPSQL